MGSLGGLTSLRNKFLFPFAALTLALSFALAYWVWQRHHDLAQHSRAHALASQQQAAETLKLEIESFSQRSTASVANALASADANVAALGALAAITPPTALKALQFAVSSTDGSVKALKPLASITFPAEVLEKLVGTGLRSGWHKLSASGQTAPGGASVSYMLYRTPIIGSDARQVGWFDSLHSAADVSPVLSASPAQTNPTHWASVLPKMIGAALLPIGFFALFVGIPLFKALRDIDYLAYVIERFKVGTPIDRLPLQRPDELGRIARAVVTLSMRVNKFAETQRVRTKVGSAVSAAQRDAIEKQRQALERSMEQVRQFAAVVEAAYEGIIILDRRFRIEYANPAFATDFRVPVSTLKGLKISDLFHPDAKQTLEQFEPVLDLGIVVRETVRCKRADSVELYAELTASPVRDEKGGITGIVIVERDVTASVMSSELMTQQLLIDPLTEVWRRSALVTEMERRAARPEKIQFSVLFVDLDGFKSINDRFGHEAGDTVLRSVGGVLKSQIRDHDVVGRYGGDEFVIVVDDDAKEANARRIAQRIVSAVPTVTGLRYPDVRFSASVGIASFPRDADTVVDLVRCADHAMYSAKRAGGSRFMSWTEVKNKPSWNSTPPAAEVLTLRRRG
jgi:diguanylate cyclase (GGDEF)-like protein/PAS domain S-box-containing protein